MKFTATKEFEAWATGYSGCDGGNINGPIWFCGIEYGGGETESDFMSDDAITPRHIEADKLRNHLKPQYNRKMAKIYSTICQQEVRHYLENAEERQLMSPKGDVFKMNLFPIAFRKDHDELWKKWIFDRTGLPTKSMYRAWCQNNRFTKIQEWVTNYNPKLIVATSTYYESDFIMAFGGVGAIYSRDIVEEEKIQCRNLVWLPINDGKTILAITPFLGYRYGINSDELMSGFGNRLNEICVDRFGENWLSK